MHPERPCELCFRRREQQCTCQRGFCHIHGLRAFHLRLACAKAAVVAPVSGFSAAHCVEFSPTTVSVWAASPTNDAHSRVPSERVADVREHRAGDSGSLGVVDRCDVTRPVATMLRC